MELTLKEQPYEIRFGRTRAAMVALAAGIGVHTLAMASGADPYFDESYGKEVVIDFRAGHERVVPEIDEDGAWDVEREIVNSRVLSKQGGDGDRHFETFELPFVGTTINADAIKEIIDREERNSAEHGPTAIELSMKPPRHTITPTFLYSTGYGGIYEEDPDTGPIDPQELLYNFVGISTSDIVQSYDNQMSVSFLTVNDLLHNYTLAQFKALHIHAQNNGYASIDDLTNLSRKDPVYQEALDLISKNAPDDEEYAVFVDVRRDYYVADPDVKTTANACVANVETILFEHGEEKPKRLKIPKAIAFALGAAMLFGIRVRKQEAKGEEIENLGLDVPVPSKELFDAVKNGTATISQKRTYIVYNQSLEKYKEIQETKKAKQPKMRARIRGNIWRVVLAVGLPVILSQVVDISDPPLKSEKEVVEDLKVTDFDSNCKPGDEVFPVERYDEDMETYTVSSDKDHVG